MLTQNGIKQEISYLYLHALVTRLGYSLEETRIDMDSVDATICAKGKIPGSTGVLYSPKIDVQLKATKRDYSDDPISFNLTKKNYDELRVNTMVPKILVILFLPTNRDWFELDSEKISIYGGGYWKSLNGMKASDNQASITIHLPQSQKFTDEAIKGMMIAAASRESLAYVSC